MSNETEVQTALSTTTPGAPPATGAQIRQQVNLIQSVMKDIFIKDTHYGIIKGCKHPSLYKPGSEVILTMFRIAVTPEVDDLSTADERRYRVRAVGRTPNGIHVGTGIGECSSNEEKYKWRRATCKAEFEATPIDRRRVKHYSDGPVNQVRVESEDVANTILKMAKKRAQIDLCLTATAASDVFSQDLEDMPEGVAVDHEPAADSKPPITKPTRTSEKKADAAATDHPAPGAQADEVLEFVPKAPKKTATAKGHRYAISLPDGRWASTFDDDYGDYLKDAATDGVKVRVTIETVVKGDQTYHNIADVRQAQA